MGRPQVPYAISAALVLVVSIAVLAGALAMGGLLDVRPAVDASPIPTTSRAPLELSRTGRLAYWRTDARGAGQLWVSNLDGSNRRTIATVDGLSRVEGTRWSPNGNAIAYLDRGQSAVVVRVDGPARYVIPLPQFVAASGNAILIELDWSTDSAMLAATVRGGTNQQSNTDVYVAAADAGSWRNATNLGNAFLSQWISPTDLLIHTQTGMIATIRSNGTGLVPLTGLVATSPFVADDGRVYFFAGQISPTVRDATVPVINAGQARVWSTTVEGGEPRQETTQLYDDVRLVTRWPSGRFVVHQGASTALAFLSNGTPPIDTTLGVVERVELSPDRRTAIGLTAGRIFRYDTAAPSAPVLLLSDIWQPDAWYPSSIAIARSSAAPAQPKPTARYAFALHGLIWATDATGVPHVLRQLGTDDRGLRHFSGVAVPAWSPDGRRILYFDVLVGSFRGAVFVTDVTGTGGRLSDLDAAGPFPTWSPDGNVGYAGFLDSPDSASFDTDAEVRVVSPTNGGRVATYRAREIAFGGGRTYLIDNGWLNLPFQTRTDHAVLEATSSGLRTISAARFLEAGAPFADIAGAPATQWQVSALGASADGAFLSARVSPANGLGSFILALFRASDGTSTIRLPGQDTADVRWSPTGHLVGMTIGNIPGVRDAETGAIVASAGSGRFAGWSPDGRWFYVARDTGLYAMPLAGGEPVWIDALGVPVSATP